MRLHFFNSAFIVNSKWTILLKCIFQLTSIQGVAVDREKWVEGGGGNFFIFDFVRILYLICICYFFSVDLG